MNVLAIVNDQPYGSERRATLESIALVLEDQGDEDREEVPALKAA